MSFGALRSEIEAIYEQCLDKDHKMSEDRFCKAATASGLMIFRPARNVSRIGQQKKTQMTPVMLALLLDTPQVRVWCKRRAL